MQLDEGCSSLPAGSRPQLQIRSSESLKNSFSSQFPSLFINCCYSEFWITIISSSRSIIFPSLIKTEWGTPVPVPRVWVFPLFSKPGALSGTQFSPYSELIWIQKRFMWDPQSLQCFLFRNSCPGCLVSVEIMKFKEIPTWQELAMQGRCFVRTSSTLTTRTFFLHIHNSRGILYPWSQGWSSIWLQLPNLPNSCGQSSSGSFAIRAVSIRGMEIHPAGCLPYGNKLLHGSSTNVSIKKWSLP